jgi:hypothetical protein
MSSTLDKRFVMKLSDRMYDILESLQYGSLYMIAAFIGGVGLDFAFPVFDDNKEINMVILETVAQCLSLIILVYIVRTGVRSIPFLFPILKNSGFTPYMTNEYEGEMMMGLIFLGVQFNLIQKIDKIARALYELFYEEERIIQNGKGKK